MKRRIENNKNIQKMEQKDINIYEILKGVEYGTELYTPMCGNVVFTCLPSNNETIRTEKDLRIYRFDKNGRWMEGGEVMLFPSKEMRDWSKFFKKGDVLVSNDSDSHIIFNGFSKNDYTTFEGKHWISVSKKRHVSCLNMQNVQDYHIEDNKDSARTYINAIEKFCGGKLNRETLEIEETQPEFKDGDVLFVKCKGDDFVEIFKCSKRNGDLYDHASLNTRTHELDISGEYKICEESIVKIRHATEEEKKQLFSALEKEGKAFDAENKQAVDLKPAKGQPAFKTFDKVLVRLGKEFKWLPALFIRDRGESFTNRYNVLPLHTGKPADFTHCIPFEGHENIAFIDYDIENLPF